MIPPTELRTTQLEEVAPLIIDVRSAEEYAAGHVEGAVHIPIDELSSRLGEVDPDQLVITYCMIKHPGTSRGERAAALLRDHGRNAQKLCELYSCFGSSRSI